MYRLIAASNDAVELLELMITHNAIIFRKGAKVSSQIAQLFEMKELNETIVG